MSIPKSPPARYTTSRQLISGADFNGLNDQLNSAQSLTAVGVAQGDAVAIDGANIEIKAGSANNAGARLPVSYPGAIVAILNNSANTTIIYGNGTDTIQNAATTFAASVNMATLTSAIFRCIKVGFWQRVIPA